MHDKLIQKPLGGPDTPRAPIPNTVRVLHCDQCDRVINADVEVHYVESIAGVFMACSMECKAALEAEEAHDAKLMAGGGQ